MKIRIATKTIALVSIVFIYRVLMNLLDPMLALYANDLAMNQMQNTPESSMGIQLYSYVRNNAWIGLVILIILIFGRDVLKVFKMYMNKKEKTNEEN